VTVRVREETPRDFAAIRDVVASAFGRADESKLVDALRDEGYARLSLVAESDGEIVGHILFSELRIVGPHKTVAALALAPLAVVPTQQKHGIGSLLAREGLKRLTDADHRIVIVLGHPDYYPRFGFSAELARQLSSLYAGESFMALELIAGAMDGVQGNVEYPPSFSKF
jgi:putative acetyltransferase